MRRIASMLVLLLAASCGGSETSLPVNPVPNVTVTVADPPGPVAGGATYQFSAVVTGTTNTAVTWTVDANGNTNVGSIDAGGRYTAPVAGGRFTVRATSVADATKTGTATVLVTAASLR